MTVEEALAIIESVIEGRLNKVQEIVFCQSWEGKSYQEIATSSGYDNGYIKDAGSKLWQLISKALEQKVTKNNLHSALKRHSRHLWALESPQIQDVTSNLMAVERFIPKQCQDWGEAIDTSVFYNRVTELALLERWLLGDRCRLVVLFGMGGIGKTTLAAKLAEQIQGKFDYLVWRSLRNAPPIQDLLAELIQFLSQEQEINLAETLDSRVLQLINHLRSSRCLVILDNAETILQEGDRTGCYREGYEGYGQLLRCVAEVSHHSCLLLTSREIPRGLTFKEGEILPVRSLQLTGLQTTEGREIFKARGEFWGSEDDWRGLIDYYAGNPLALKMVAPAIQNFFDSNVSKFLEFVEQNTFILDDIRNLLEQQFNRLSDIEKEVMYWLAINREPVSFLELSANFVLNVRGGEILEALAALHRRSLIEKSADGFTQQPVVMDYIREKQIQQVDAENDTHKHLDIKDLKMLKPSNPQNT